MPDANGYSIFVPGIFKGLIDRIRTWTGARKPVRDCDIADRMFVPLLEAPPPAEKPARVVCFYLPQFHQIPENDAWWGEGFTEWTNVRRAQAKYESHYQPRFPGELGYYNLLDRSVQHRQIELAKTYGIEGFCFYIYWFEGKRLLERPVEAYLADASLDLPFCLCWANENWTRRWDGLDREVLIAQYYSAEDDLAFIAAIAPYLKDPRAIKIDGKPLLAVYRPNLFPSAKETAQRWRDWCRSHGVGEIYLAYTQSFDKASPQDFGFDAAIEFPPIGIVPSDVSKEFLPSRFARGKDRTFRVYDWREFVTRSAHFDEPGYKIFRATCPGWDNTGRRVTGAHIFGKNTPALYQEWMLNCIGDARRRFSAPSEQLVFVNAWNEWGEGAYLEPDDRYGYAYLEATRMALARAALQERGRGGDPAQARIAVIIHAYYAEVLPEILASLGGADARLKLFVTTAAAREAEVRAALARMPFEHEVLICANRGRDILPFLDVLRALDPASFPFVLKLHTKKSVHRADGTDWRANAYACLAASAQRDFILRQLDASPDIGLVGPRGQLVSMERYRGSNLKTVAWLAGRLGFQDLRLSEEHFIAGTMFLARIEALQPMLNLALSIADFEVEAGQVDGTLAHAIERAFTYSARAAGLGLASVGSEDASSGRPLDRAGMDDGFAYAQRSAPL